MTGDAAAAGTSGPGIPLTSPVGDQPTGTTGRLPPGPMREVLASVAYRRYWITQFLSALASGSLRFTYVWMVLEATDSDAAVGAVGLAFGLPALVVTLPAGVVSDRVDRRRLIVVGQVVAAAALAATAVAVWADLPAVVVAVPSAVVSGLVLSGLAPALQAVVPSLVPPERLMTGVALQSMGMTLSLLLGALVSGATIAVAGVGGAFAVLAGLQGVAAWSMRRVELPAARRPAGPASGGDLREGISFCVRTEPVRSLLTIGLIVGTAWGVVQVVLPEVSREVLDRGAFPTSALFGALSLGLMITSLALASRGGLRRPGLVMAVALAVGAGGGVMAMGLSRSWWLTLLIMFAWGLAGGTAMTIQRTLLQRHTPDALMGRVMGVSSLVMLGSFPAAAVVGAALMAAVGPADALVVTGAATAAAASAVVWRRPVRGA